MKLSRRDFIGSGIALLGSTALTPRPARGWIHGSGGQGKGQVNLNILSQGNIDFPWINHFKSSVGWSLNIPGATQDPWPLLNSDGYPTAMCSGTTAWNAQTYIYYNNTESFFSGSITGNTMTVTGTVTGQPLFVGQAVQQTNGGTGVPYPTRITGLGTGSGGAGTYTVSPSVGSPTGPLSMTAFMPWVMDWGSGTYTIFGNPSTQTNGAFNYRSWSVSSTRTEYNVYSNSLSGASFTLSLSAGNLTGTVSGLTGTLFIGQVITGLGLPPFATISAISGSNVTFSFGTGQALTYGLSSLSCTGAPVPLGQPVLFQADITAITNTPNNVRLYRQDEETLLNNGQVTAPHTIKFYKQYGRLRFMNWQLTNGCMCANWADRTPSTAFAWSGLNPILPTKYSGQCPASTKAVYVGPNALPGNPSSWTDKMSFMFSTTDSPAFANIIGFIDNGAGGGSPSGTGGNTLTVTSTVAGSLRAGLQIRAVQNGTVSNCNILSGSGSTWTVDGSAQNIASQLMVGFAVITNIDFSGGAFNITSANHGMSTNDWVTIPWGEISPGNLENYLSGATYVSGTVASLGFYQVTVINTNTFSLQTATPPAAYFTGSISGNVLTITGTITGGTPTIRYDGSMELLGAGITPGSVFITGSNGGTGGAGQYFINTSLSIGSESMYASSTISAYTSGGVFYPTPQFKCGSLPAKPIIGNGIGSFGGSGFFQYNSGTPNNLLVVGFYDIYLNCLIVSTSGSNNTVQWGMPFEIAVQTANEINGPDAWINVPAYFTDSSVNSMASYIKSNLKAPLRWCFELSNEVWNQGAGFYQTEYAYAVGQAQFSIEDGSALDQWFGWRWYNMIQQVNAVYGSSAQNIPGLVRIFSFRMDTTAPTNRITAPSTSIPVNCLTLADELCWADYLGPSSDNNALPAAVDVYNFQQAFITGNNAAMQSALNNLDACYNAYSCGFLFNPIVGSISGTTLTVTNMDNNQDSFTAPTNPRIGPYTVIGPYSGSAVTSGTYVIQQLTNTQPGGTPNKLGTYQLSQSSTVASSSNMQAFGSFLDRYVQIVIPNFVTLANTYGCKVCCYEGGIANDILTNGNVPTSYSGNPLNIQDKWNFYVTYWQSSQAATTYLNFLHAAKAAGLTYSSQYCMTDPYPETLNYGLVEPTIFGSAWLVKTSAFDIYNAGG